MICFELCLSFSLFQILSIIVCFSSFAFTKWISDGSSFCEITPTDSLKWIEWCCDSSLLIEFRKSFVVIPISSERCISNCWGNRFEKSFSESEDIANE